MVERSQEDLRREEEFRRIFETYLPKGVGRAISVGCGTAGEARGFLAAFPGAFYLGIDSDEKKIEIARRIHQDLSVFRFQVQVTNALNIQVFGQEKWDLVLLRNVPYYAARSGVDKKNTHWRPVFLNCIEGLRNRGWIYLSSEDKDEIEETVRFFIETGRITRTVAPLRNRLALSCSGSPFHDTYIATLHRNGL